MRMIARETENNSDCLHVSMQTFSFSWNSGLTQYKACVGINYGILFIIEAPLR